MLQKAEQAEQTSKLLVGYKPTTLASVENRFDEEDIKIINQLGLDSPLQLSKKNVDELEEYQNFVKGKIKRKTNEIAGLKKTKKKDVSKKIEKSSIEGQTLKAYSATITDLINLKTNYAKPKKDKGIYKQPKRNAYKIQDGNYGGLLIDLPKLMNEMK